MKKREKGMAHRAKRRTGELDRGGLHAGRDAKHGFFQNEHTATSRRPEATAMCKTPIFPGASTPATNRKFFLVAGMLRSRFCRKMRHFSTKRGFFQVLAYPLQRKNFPPWRVYNDPDFAGKCVTFPQNADFSKCWHTRYNGKIFHHGRCAPPRILYPDPRFSGVKHGPSTDRIRQTGGGAPIFTQNADFPRG